MATRHDAGSGPAASYGLSGGFSGGLAARAVLYVSPPVGVVLLLLAGPMVALAMMSVTRYGITGIGGFVGIDNYTTALTDSGYLHVLLNTAEVTTVAMAVMLIVGFPLAYIMAFRLGWLEIPFLLLLVLSDQLSPVIKVYAWRILLGREGIINNVLLSIGAVDHPIDALLFNRFAVVIVTTASYIGYTAIPIYAALKAVDARILEVAADLGGTFMTTMRTILIPLASPGIFVAILLVYIPVFSEFIIPALVGGTSGFMAGNAIEQEMLDSGNWGLGSAMSFIQLFISGTLVLLSYYAARIRRLEHTG